MKDYRTSYLPNNYIITLGDAAQAGNVKLVLERLADKNVQVDEQASKESSTPLMFAAANGHLEVVQILLNHGATIDLQTSGGLTALMCAILRNHEEVVLELLKRKANIALKDQMDNDALRLATDRKNEKIINLILDYTQVEEKQAAITSFFSNTTPRLGFFNLPTVLTDIVKNFAKPEFYPELKVANSSKK